MASAGQRAGAAFARAPFARGLYAVRKISLRRSHFQCCIANLLLSELTCVGVHHLPHVLVQTLNHVHRKDAYFFHQAGGTSQEHCPAPAQASRRQASSQAEITPMPLPPTAPEKAKKERNALQMLLILYRQ